MFDSLRRSLGVPAMGRLSQPVSRALFAARSSFAVSAAVATLAALFFAPPPGRAAVTGAPTFTIQPASATIKDGASLVVNVRVTTSDASPVTWKLSLPTRTLSPSASSSSQLNNVITASLSFGPLSLSDAGAFTLIASNTSGSTSSATCTLTVTAVAPAITQQPAPSTVPAGSPATFTVGASGSAPLRYEWRKDGVAIVSATDATYAIPAVREVDAGIYTVAVSNSVASVVSTPASLTVSAPVAPTITAEPVAQSVPAHGSATLSVTAEGSPPLAYQWSKDGQLLADATSAVLTLMDARSSDAGTYAVVVSNPAGSATSAGATVTVHRDTRIVNMSVLTGVEPGETLTFGYFLGGDATTGTRPILMRAMGPTLGAPPFNVAGTLADPFMEFYNGTTPAARNNDWDGAAEISKAVTTVQAFPFLSGSSKDAAIYAAAVDAATPHSIKVAGVERAAGAVIAELYDAAPGRDWGAPRLVNVSLLKHMGATTTLGFYIDGTSPMKVLIRAIGPTVGGAPFNVGGTMADPKLALYSQADTSAPVAINDDWSGTAELSAAFDATGAFALDAASKDAALLQTLAPGGYSVQVSAATGSTGVALIEVYEVP